MCKGVGWGGGFKNVSGSLVTHCDVLWFTQSFLVTGKGLK